MPTNLPPEYFEVEKRYKAATSTRDQIRLLEELISCTAWHFRHEERLMLKYEYDAFEDHKAEHRDLIDGVRALQQKFHDADKQLTGEDFEYLSQWLTEHIVRNDMRMGFHLTRVMY